MNRLKHQGIWEAGCLTGAFCTFFSLNRPNEGVFADSVTVHTVLFMEPGAQPGISGNPEQSVEKIGFEVWN